MKSRKVVSFLTLAAMLVSPAVFAADIQVRAVSCVSAAQNPRVVAQLPANAQSARVYFKAEGQTSEYYVDMRRDNGNWVAFLPIPAATTRAVSYRVVPVDNKGVQTSSALLSTTVAASCPAQALTADEQRMAQNLAVGQTTASQSSIPTGFQCVGVVSYITVAGDLKPNDECRRVLAAAAAGAAAPGGATAGTAGAAGATAATAATLGGLSTGTLTALGALALAAGGYAVYENNKSTTPASPSHP